jgi:hypothetical protein
MLPVLLALLLLLVFSIHSANNPAPTGAKGDAVQTGSPFYF